MRKLTDFGLCVKTELLRKGETMEWLASRVRQDTEMFVDGAYISKILYGERNPSKIVASICKILSLEEPSKEAG